MDNKIGSQVFKKAPPHKHFPMWDRVYCPFCKETHWWKSIRMHLTRKAQSEAFLFLVGELKDKPHFDFWKKNNTRARSHFTWIN